MDTIRHEGKTYHIGCGGEVVRGICIKCGQKKKSLRSRIFGDGPFIIREKDESEKRRREHRDRIRSRKDIYRE